VQFWNELFIVVTLFRLDGHVKVSIDLQLLNIAPISVNAFMLVGKDTVDNKTQLAKALFKLVKLF
jgi:hypothetical protein